MCFPGKGTGSRWAVALRQTAVFQALCLRLFSAKKALRGRESREELIIFLNRGRLGVVREVNPTLTLWKNKGKLKETGGF